MSRTTDARARATRSLAGRRAPRVRLRARRPRPGAVLAGSLALFLALLALLAWQMRGGADPALGAGTSTTRPRPARVVVVHRVVRRVVVVHRPAAAPTASAPASSAPAAPAPAPAAAAPAPAPVVTRAS